MNVIQFFSGMGHFMARTFTIIRKIVPEPLLIKAIGLAQQAAVKFTDNNQRRDWVIAELSKTVPGMTESMARFLVELAVQHLKADVIDKAAGKAVAEVGKTSAGAAGAATAMNKAATPK